MTIRQRAADEHAYELFAAYSGVPLATVAMCASNFPRFNHHAWQDCAGATWEAKARRFCNEADVYLFDLLFGSQTKRRRKEIYQQFHHWPWFERAGAGVMEFGTRGGRALFRRLGLRCLSGSARAGQPSAACRPGPARGTRRPTGR